MFEVSSEIYKETNFQPVKTDGADGKVVSKFRFHYPQDGDSESQLPAIMPTTDKDGDLVVCRRAGNKRAAIIEIEHSEATVLKLVGLQVWRGALLLADYFIHQRKELRDKQLLELGAGVGLTSIVAALYARRVICTDVDIGGILNLIRANVNRNQKKFAEHCCAVEVMECDFMQQPEDYAKELQLALAESDILMAADVIYDDELTDAFIRVLDGIFEMEQSSGKKKVVYVALEKRYVFTLAELDAVAPMFEYFLRQTRQKPWHFEYIPIDFPQFFEYERCKQLVLLKITSS